MLICRCHKRELLAKLVLPFGMNIAKQSNSPEIIYTVNISCSSMGDWRGGKGGKEGTVSSEYLSAWQLPLVATPGSHFRVAFQIIKTVCT